ncbi:uncharacterized protein CPUR_01939 [Claviceps purpurea 20.1]|uniref:Uncharacterized protein n=1 Tax=Claviceps purpurea (strain 20.1) TaxID=1111077 RepID=M1W7H9_CLAP2|nr:uncharacterized protein CPUR_01939 [Claviceps purpurea 20.1]
MTFQQLWRLQDALRSHVVNALLRMALGGRWTYIWTKDFSVQEFEIVH